MKDLVAITYFNLGTIYENQKEYFKAEEAYQNCISFTGDSELKSRAEQQIAIVKDKG